MSEPRSATEVAPSEGYRYSLSTLMLAMTLAAVGAWLTGVEFWVGVIFFATTLVALVRARMIALQHLHLVGHPLGRQKRIYVYFESLLVVWGILVVVLGVSLFCFPVNAFLGYVILEVAYAFGLRLEYNEFVAAIVGSLPVAVLTLNVVTKALWPAKRYVDLEDLQREASMRLRQKFAICLDAEGQGDLRTRKLYRIVPDPVAETEGLLRVVDESGEEYFYPAARFAVVQFSATVEKRILAAGG